MRNIKVRFDRIQNKCPFHGSFTVLALAVRNQKFTQSSISRAFSKLVPSDEYDKKERRMLIKFLTEISNHLEGDKIIEKNSSGEGLMS